MRRYILLFALLVVLLAACTGDPPSDTRGCIAEEGQTAEEIYNRDDGCRNGSIIAEEGEGHGEEAEDEHGEDAEDTEQSESEGTPTEEAPAGESQTDG